MFHRRLPLSVLAIGGTSPLSLLLPIFRTEVHALAIRGPLPRPGSDAMSSHIVAVCFAKAPAAAKATCAHILCAGRHWK
ncbi:MAG: hypothetical protein COA41_09295 [Sphingopyxis sp.]|nr:MAG: hypothetical protein COA41_09295 [Sphingopyxis sp.]